MDTDILNKAKYYCARAERSPRNLRLFLMRREVPSDEIDEYLALLQEGRYAEEHGPLGSWIAAQECVVSGAREDARRSAR